MCQHAVPRLLIVESDPDTARMMLESLAEHFGRDCATCCSTVKEALAHDAKRLDLVLTDMNLPDGTGLELLEQLRQRRPDLPVVLVTGVAVAEAAAAAITCGACDYLLKVGEFHATMPLVVEKNLALWRVRQENHRLHAELKQTLEQVRVKNEQLEQAVAKLKHMAATDPLTELANRRSFGRSLERCFAEAQRHDHELSCLMIDIDAFKEVNDTLGHQAGDRLLHAAGRVLEAICRRSDVAGRYGGDELVVLLPRAGEAKARQVAQRIRDHFAEASAACLKQGPQGRAAAPPPMVTMSMGLASLAGSRAGTPEHLVACADHALYRAKLAGKGRLMAYRPVGDGEPHAHEDADVADPNATRS